MTVTARPFGELLRQWRERRRLSQLELSLTAAVSTRHLSFVETGRSAPSRELVLQLAEHLDVPLRERNRLLLAAGYAPVFGETPLDAPRMSAVRAAVGQVLAGHEPYPAAVVDRGWNLVDANRSLALLTDLVDPRLLAPPANVLRASLHPDGLAPHIANLAEWRAHLLARLRRQVDLTADPGLEALLAELRGYPGGPELPALPAAGEIVIPLRLRAGGGELAFLSTIAAFGTPLDVTVAELSIESFYPADPATAAALRARG
ncbi:MAG TPA: helix-turn-helix transcriptional regulator [Mycobacteriales bacterium]|nr:helix-turn-helix transcriptional regulator [Mycobacteriales bacterium]